MLTNIGASLRRWRRRFSRAEWEIGRLKLRRSEAPSHSPGLLLIQVDGLGRSQLEHALARRRMPFLARLIKRDGCRLHTFYSGQPATTPAVQGELYYGVRTAVPAFSFLDPKADGIGVMFDSVWAKRVEADLAARGDGLLTGGSSWSNIYTGGAAQEESHFCGASIGWSDMWRTGKIRNLFLFAFLHFPAFLRLLALLPLEFVLSAWDAVRGMLRGQSIWREFIFIFARVFICVGLREMVTLGAKIDLARGLPIVHVNFLGYDEQSHRRGPRSRFAHWTLRGIDRAILNLQRAARRSEGRDYEVWIFSDHGQIACRPFARKVDGGLEALVARLWPDLPETTRATRHGLRDQHRLAHAPFLRRVLRRGPDRSHLTSFEQAEFVVTCMGPVGHIYLKRPLPPDGQLALARQLLAEGVPGVLLCREDRKVLWLTQEREAILPDDTSLFAGPDDLRPQIARDLAALASHPCSGNLVCLGWKAGGPSYSFAEENGAHCGPSPEETCGFLLVPPASSHLVSNETVRPGELRQAALTHLGRSPRPVHRRRSSTPTRLRVVTYNVHYCKGLDGRFAPDRVARVLRELDPDLVALQELDCGRPRSRGDDQLAYLATELGLHQIFAPSIVNGEERYGHGLLSTHPLRHVRQARLPTGGGPVIEPRDALYAMMQLGDRELAVISTHLGLSRPERAAQIDRLLDRDFLGGIEPDRPALLMGDLNLTPGGKLYRRLVSRWTQVNGHACFRDVQAHAPGHVAVKTFPAFFPLRQLDHIFATSHFHIHRVYSPANLLTRRASDHLPLVAELELHG